MSRTCSLDTSSQSVDGARNYSRSLGPCCEQAHGPALGYRWLCRIGRIVTATVVGGNLYGAREDFSSCFGWIVLWVIKETKDRDRGRHEAQSVVKTESPDLTSVLRCNVRKTAQKGELIVYLTPTGPERISVKEPSTASDRGISHS